MASQAQPSLRRTRAKVLTMSLIRKRLKEQHEDSSSDSSDDDVLLEYELSQLQKRKARRMRVMNYVELTVNLYSDVEFKSHFRLSRSTCDFLLNLIGQRLVRKIDGQPQVDPEKQVLIALWRMGNTESYRSICDRFNVGKATAHLCVTRVTESLVQNICKFIKWPTPTEANAIMRGFRMTSGFPDTLGAIDGTHIEIEAPKENLADYINRKGYPSLQLQAVCDDKMVFRHIFVGFPGSVHDQRIFRNSPVQELIKDSSKFPGNSHLVGDAAYALDPHLMTPFKDNGHLSERQKNYNYCHSSARVTIERTFGQLKGRWRSLLNCLPMNNLRRMPHFIAACCILHNICLLRNDQIDINLTSSQLEVESMPVSMIEDHNIRAQHGQNKRNYLMNTLAMAE